MSAGDFVAMARHAFSHVTSSHGLELGSVGDDQWYGMVEWHGDGVSLRVSDDRRGNFTQVFVCRPLEPSDLERWPLLVVGQSVRVPLWAVIEAAGGDPGSGSAVGPAEQRWGQLASLAESTEAFTAALLDGDWAAMSRIHAVVARHHEGDVEDGRAGRRLP